MVAVVLILLYLAVQRAVNSPWGRVLRAIREDEVAAQASGKDVYSFKMQAFILGSIIMGIGGALYAHHIRFIAPVTFDPLLATFVIWAMLMVGGSGNNKGALLGCLRGVGHLVGDSVFAVVLRRPQLPVLHDWGLDCWGDSAAPGGNIGRDAERCQSLQTELLRLPMTGVETRRVSALLGCSRHR